MVYVVKQDFVRPYQQIGRYDAYKARVNVIDKMSEYAGIWKDGSRLLEAHEVPDKVILQKKAKLIDAFLSRGGVFLVSDGLRGLIEDMDPGVHQFFPLEVEFPRGNLPDKKYNIMNVTVQKDTIIPDMTHVEKFADRHFLLKDFQNKATFSPESQKGAHIWREKQIVGGRCFISTNLMQAIQSNGFKFFKCWPGKILSEA